VSNLKVVQKWKEFKEIDYMKAWAKLEYNQMTLCKSQMGKNLHQMFLERVISLMHTLYAATFQIGGRRFCSIWNLNPLGKGITCIDFNKFVYMTVNFVLENA
jgi:hypothetical protein